MQSVFFDWVSKWRNVGLLAGLLAAGGVACGKMQEAANTVQQKAVEAKDGAKDATKEGAQSLTERADDWVNLEPIEDRRKFCAAEQGTLVDSISISPCENGLVTFEFDGEVQQQSCDGGEGGKSDLQCLHRNDDGEIYFNDGPSVPNIMQSLTGAIADRADMRAYNHLYWPAGVAHDYCYHHGLAVDGTSQSECDKRYFSDLRAICVHAEGEGIEWFRPDTCRKVAAAHYMAVRSQGSSAFNVVNAHVKAPAYEPLWQVYGLAEDALDEETLAEIEHRLSQAKMTSD